MSTEELKQEIGKVLDHFSDQTLAEALAFLKELETKNQKEQSTASLMNKILVEDKDVLTKLDY